MNRLQQLDWRSILQIGGLAGLALLYFGLIGMVEAFNERDVIRDMVTLGQLLIFVPALLGGYRVGQQLRDEEPAYITVLLGIMIGLVTAIPSLLLLAFANQVEVRDVFVNINRDWIEIISFDNRKDLVKGGMILLGTLGASGLVGALWSLIPEAFRRALIFGTGLMLVVGIMGETVSLILEEIFSDDLLDLVFKRDSLLWQAALGLFVGGTAFSLLNEEYRRTIVFGIVTAIAIVGFRNLAYALPDQLAFIRDNAGTIVHPVLVVVLAVGAAVTRYSLLARKPENSTASGAANAEQAERGRQMETAVLVMILMVAPWLVGRALSDVMVTVGLFVLMGLGLNVAIGLAGLLDLGYVTNYAVGAYILAVLTSVGPQRLGPEWMNFWIVIPIALLAAMFAGFFFAVPVLKMRGDYLAIATLGFGEIIGRLANSDALAPLIGGAQGVLHIPKPVFFGIELRNPEQLYYLVLVACLVTLIVSIRLNNSRTGRQWMAIREDEDVASAMGINVPLAKLLAFTISAATGGVAGAIFAAKVGAVFPNSFLVLVSINVLSLIIVGGMGSNPGIILGAIVLMGAPELLREFSEYRWLLYGALLVWMMINRPEGLWPSQVTRREMQGADDPVLQTAQAATE